MTRFKSPALPLFYCGLLLAALAVGCSTRETADETLPMQGNHSPGTLAMVTTDTSSDGYHYLEPAVSPDGTRIAFTADWAALPPTGQPPDPVPTSRQIVLIPNRVGLEPERRLAQSGAMLVPFPQAVNVVVPGREPWLLMARDAQKGSPVWLDDQTLICWIHFARGDRLCRVDLTQEPIVPEVLYFEPEDFQSTGRFWQHHDPAVSPDGQWVAFTRFGSSGNTPDSLLTYTKQQLCVVSLGRSPAIMVPITSEAALIGNPAWSADGGRIAFNSTLDLVGGGGSFYGSEIFTITFDGAQAATGTVPVDQGLKRLTFTSIPDGNPIPIENVEPSFSADGSTIVFTSTRRAPSITLHDRSIWKIPSDGRLEPVIAFFSREDDVQATFLPGSNNTLVLSSSMGFPTEMLDRIELETRDAIRAADPQLNDVQVNQLAAAKRTELEYFVHVMTHVFVFQGW